MQPSKWMIKQVVWQVKQLARDFFSGDPEMLRRVEKAMAEEEETVAEAATNTALLKLGNLVHDSVHVDNDEARRRRRHSHLYPAVVAAALPPRHAAKRAICG